VTRHIHPDDPEGAHRRNGPTALQGFGQEIDQRRLNLLARRMTATTGDGTPAPWAGFAWHGPVSRRSTLPLNRPRPARAA
jgi:hypothetical protein